MDYQEDFLKYVSENKLEEARIALEKGKFLAMEEPFYYANMGWLLNHMERYQEAEVNLRKGIFAFPDDGWMFSQLGFSMNRQGKLESGLEALLEALEIGFDEPWLHGEIGWCYKEKKDFLTAIDYFENALMEDDKNDWILSQAAYTYLEINDTVTAEEYFKKSYVIHSDFDGLYDLINFYKTVKRYEDAITFLEAHKTMFCDWCAYELGVAYYEMGNDKESCRQLLKALKLGKDDTNVRVQLGDVYLRMHKIKESNKHYNVALRYYEKALLKEEDTYWIYQEMIWIAHKQKNMKKKLSYLNRASKDHEKTLWLMYHYARCYSDLQKHALAAEACSYCLKHGEISKDMYDLYAWNLGRNAQEHEAISVIEDCMKKFEADDWNYGELGLDYAQLKDYEKAAYYYGKAVSMAPKNPLHVSSLGWCQLRLNCLEEALSNIQKAINLGRNDGWLYSVLAEIYSAKDNYFEAITHFQFAIEHDYDEVWIHEEIKVLQQKIMDNDTSRG